jgi:hypothetical protein
VDVGIFPKSKVQKHIDLNIYSTLRTANDNCGENTPADHWQDSINITQPLLSVSASQV